MKSEPSPPHSADRLPPQQIVEMHALFLFTGMGAMLLGPLLPSLAAQFLGSFAGSTTFRPNLKLDLAPRLPRPCRRARHADRLPTRAAPTQQTATEPV